MMPMFLLSGVFFSAANFPGLLQPLVCALPLAALNDAMRAVMNEGASLAAVAPLPLYLTAVAAVTFGVPLKIFAVGVKFDPRQTRTTNFAPPAVGPLSVAASLNIRMDALPWKFGYQLADSLLVDLAQGTGRIHRAR
jgi:hypothetical protein